MKITDSYPITGKDNSRLKIVRAVRDGRETGSIYVEGVRLVSELARSGLKAKSVFVSDNVASKLDGLVGQLAGATGAEVFLVASKVFDSITDTDNSQGLVVLADHPKKQTLDELKAGTGLLVYLSRVSNPSNLGAVVRTAEAAGAVGIVTSARSADPFSPKALRSSMGSAMRLPISIEVSIEEAVAYAGENGSRTIAADTKASKAYTEADWGRPTMLIFGSEAHGLSDDEIGMVDETVRIPMQNGVESLNLAVSAGILLFEAKRQRDSGQLSDR